MSVRPHKTKGKGWWIIDYYPAGRKGKRRRITFKGSEGDAMATEQALRRSPGQAAVLVSPLVKDLVATWLEYYKEQVRPRTYQDAVDCMSHWLPSFGYYKPNSITRTAINNYKLSQLKEIANKAAVERGKAPRLMSKRTINKTLSYLSSFLRWAAENGHCSDMSFKIQGFPAKQTRSRVPKPLTPRQITNLYEKTDEAYKLLFLLMSDMGLRRSEALHIMADDVDEYRETINIIGKGGKQRSIPFLSNRVADELNAALEKRASGHLIVNPKTEKPYDQTAKWIARAAKEAKIVRHVHPHLLRHSCLSNLAMKGMSPHALQQIAGHANIETTNRIYVHIRHDFVQEEAAKIREGA